MSDSGYRGFIRGIKGSTKEHLTDLEFKIKKETEKLEKITNYVYQQTKLNGKKYQEIDIHYAGVGIIAIPLNEYELENAFQQSIKNIKTA